ncbi:MAG TPA: UvrD-helicase domain-containing protein, partial [Ktedonobacterales bacterium]
MKRIAVIEHAASALWARYQTATEGTTGSERIERLCDVLGLELQACPSHDVMLGGAFSRLQLYAWAEPEIGGNIWLRNDLEPEMRLFAIAHELGHYVLHRGEGINLHAACDQHAIDQQADPESLRTEEHVVEEYSPRVWREMEASAFAAELLAPRAQVRHLFTADARMDAARLAHRFGISRTLADRRLIDAVLAPTRPRDNTGVATQSALGENEKAKPGPGDLIGRLDEGQILAARALGPALVIAGPGTGKTATLVGRVAHLIQERQIPPEKVLALTFSNRAAGEMRERLAGSGLPGERMPIMTIHAFAAMLLRSYASRVPHAPDEAELTPEFRILDEANAYLLMEELLGELPLHYYRSLGNPTAPLRSLLQDFSQARDALLSPAKYQALVDTMRLMPPPSEKGDERPGTPGSAKKGQRKKPQPPEGTYTYEQIARARERAAAYAVWDRALRRRGLVDFGGLVQRAVELLRANPAVLAEVRSHYPEILVDEFQDTNYAAAELLFLVAGASGSGLWVVGDQNQSIYRFRGASPRNRRRLVEHYAHLRVLTLRRCYRSVPGIVGLGSAMAARMAELAPTSASTPGEALSSADALHALHTVEQPLHLEPVRGDGTHPAIMLTESFVSPAHERVGLAAAVARFHDLGYAYGDQAILCRTHRQGRQIAAVLARQEVPVSQLGDFFERPEIKDALMLLALATGPDARGILRAAPLLAALGHPTPSGQELAAAARSLSSQRRALPGALREHAILSKIPLLSAQTRAGLARLGEVAIGVRNGQAVGSRLSDFLMRPGGYAWRLARVADGLDTPHHDDTLPGMVRPAQAQQALAALGELVRLAWRFDTRWSQEPDFRARLSRAVTRPKATRRAEPDTLTPPPNADVAPDPISPAAASGTHAQGTETAPAVRCFLHYLHALRASDVVVPVPAGDEDAVHVLTLHQSKGLEFPVVLLPNLAHGQFPIANHGRDEVAPPGFRESDAPGEREAEERCLFYVGVTRARDIVAFTRATSYSASRRSERSTLLALLDDAPGWPDAAQLLTDDECEQLLPVSATFEESDEEESDEEEGQFVPVTSARAADMPIFRLHELEQYLACPRQYKYARSYGLLDPAEDAVYRFHRYIRKGMQ